MTTERFAAFAASNALSDTAGNCLHSFIGRTVYATVVNMLSHTTQDGTSITLYPVNLVGVIRLITWFCCIQYVTRQFTIDKWLFSWLIYNWLIVGLSRERGNSHARFLGEG